MSLSPLSLQLGTSMIIILWQIESSQGFPPIPLSLVDLPMMWRKCSLMFYWGSDAMLWKLEQHFQVSVLYLRVKAVVGGGWAWGVK